MGKYVDLETNIFSIFALQAWKDENIKTMPSNYINVVGDSPFIRVSIIPSGDGLNLKSSSGLVIADIFVKAGGGPRAVSIIADKLDTYLVGKTISQQTCSTQFQKSSLALIGFDTDNASFYRAKYEITFNHFGV